MTRPAPRWYPELWDEAWMREQYITQGKSQAEIAASLGCTRHSVLRAMKALGITARPPHTTAKLQGRSSRRFSNWELADVEWLREYYEQQEQTMPEIAEMLGCSLTAVQRAIKKAGITPRTPGKIRENHQRTDATLPSSADGRKRKRYYHDYTKIHVPDHPKADKNGYVVEHRWVAEQSLGRPLGKWEVVHHIDGVRTNNAPENLRVFPSQRAHQHFHETLRREGTDA